MFRGTLTQIESISGWALPGPTNGLIPDLPAPGGFLFMYILPRDLGAPCHVKFNVTSVMRKEKELVLQGPNGVYVLSDIKQVVVLFGKEHDVPVSTAFLDTYVNNDIAARQNFRH